MDNEPPVPVTRNVNDVLRELGVRGKSDKAKRAAVAENVWRLRPEEVGWLNEAGLTELTVEAAKLMAIGWSESAAREASAVAHGKLGGTSGKE